jgi:hypothetical protein
MAAALSKHADTCSDCADVFQSARYVTTYKNPHPCPTEGGNSTLHVGYKHLHPDAAQLIVGIQNTVHWVELCYKLLVLIQHLPLLPGQTK